MPKLFTPSNTAVQEASRLLDDLFGPVLTAKVADGDRLWLSTKREDLLRVAQILASEPALGLDYLSFVGGTDMQEYFEVLYYLYSFSRPLQVALKVRLPHDDPSVPSVSSLWPTANWHERETFDLVGITFTGHPDLRRILTAEGFTAHPLRKDFVTRAPSRDEVLEYIDVNLPDIK